MRRQKVFRAILVVFALIVLSWRCLGVFGDRAIWRSLVGQTITLSGQVFGDPELAENGVQKLKLRRLDIEGAKLQGWLYVTLNFEQKIPRDAVLTLSGKLAESFGAFNGAFYLPQLIRVDLPSANNPIAQFRQHFQLKISQALASKRESSLGLAYLLGFKGDLDAQTKQALQLVGLTHLVVASGTHLGILVGKIRQLCGRYSRFAAVFCAILAVLAFGEMIGWTASITRAAIVAILSLLAWYYGLELVQIRVLFFAMWLTLMFEPLYLFDLGWQLSFLSFFALMVLAPRLSAALYPRRPNSRSLPPLWHAPFVLTEMLITSCATLICVAPVLFYNFGYLSLASLIANLLISPTLPLVMLLTFLTGLFPFLAPLPRLILHFHLWIIDSFAARPFFLLHFQSQNPAVFLAYLPLLFYLICGAWTCASKRRRRAQIIRAQPSKFLRWSPQK